mgnify:CR=1 FL=1
MDKLTTRVESQAVCYEHLRHKLSLGVTRCDVDYKTLYVATHNPVEGITYLAMMLSYDKTLSHLMLEHIAGKVERI